MFGFLVTYLDKIHFSDKLLIKLEFTYKNKMKNEKWVGFGYPLIIYPLLSKKNEYVFLFI
jgi:hypothetical protein